MCAIPLRESFVHVVTRPPDPTPVPETLRGVVRGNVQTFMLKHLHASPDRGLRFDVPSKTPRLCGLQ